MRKSWGLMLAVGAALALARRPLIEAIRQKWHPLWRLRKSSLYRHLQSRADRTVFVKMDSLAFPVAVKALRDAALWTSQTVAEPHVQQAFLSVYRAINPKVFWDVGGNIGYYSWLTLSQCDGASAVLFEADATNCGLISQTISSSGLAARAQAIHAAVSDREGMIAFLTDPVSGATGSIVSSEKTEFGDDLRQSYGLDQIVTVKSIPLDSFLGSGGTPPDLIKIDVEGAEGLVIRGARETLRRHMPVLIMETVDADVLQELTDLGYHVVQIDTGNVLCVPERWRGALVPGQKAVMQAY